MCHCEEALIRRIEFLCRISKSGRKIIEMSDQEIGKKEIETDELCLFLEAYECVTGGKLSLIGRGENPDFICKRQDGGIVGVELTKVMRDPRAAFLEYVLDQKEEMDPYEAQEYIHHLLERKEKARSARYVENVKKTILVLQLVDGSLGLLKNNLEGLESDFIDHGFSEIWLADYSGLEAFGDIELFGLFPREYWGYHLRPWPYRKPYG